MKLAAIPEVMLDFDGPVPSDLLDRVRMMAKYLGCKAGPVVVMPSAHRGFHVRVWFHRPLPPLAVVAVQSILGSDPARERFNLVRALVLDDVPTFWRDRWNVLYRAKSKEEGMTVDRRSFGGGGQLLAGERPPRSVGERRQAWTAKDLGGATVGVFIIMAVESITVPASGKQKARDVLVLTFEEDPHKAFYLNATMIDYVLDRLGNEEREWIGKRLPVEKITVENPQSGEDVTKLWVCPPETWPKHLKASGRARKTSK